MKETARVWGLRRDVAVDVVRWPWTKWSWQERYSAYQWTARLLELGMTCYVVWQFRSGALFSSASLVTLVVACICVFALYVADLFHEPPKKHEDAPPDEHPATIPKAKLLIIVVIAAAATYAFVAAMMIVHYPKARHDAFASYLAIKRLYAPPRW